MGFGGGCEGKAPSPAEAIIRLATGEVGQPAASIAAIFVDGPTLRGLRASSVPSHGKLVEEKRKSVASGCLSKSEKNRAYRMKSRERILPA
jgi:hypothetical protein